MKTKRFNTRDGRQAVKMTASGEEEWKAFTEGLAHMSMMHRRLRPGAKDTFAMVADRLRENYRGSDPAEQGRPTAVLPAADYHSLLAAFCDAVELGSMMIEVIAEDIDNREKEG